MKIRKNIIRTVAIVVLCATVPSVTAAAFAGGEEAPLRLGALVKGSLGLGAVRTVPPFALVSAEKFPVVEQPSGSQVAGIGSFTERAMTVVPAPKPAVKRTVKTTSRKTTARKSTPAPVSSTGWRTSKVTWYGPGLYGNTMAGGGKLTPTSMVVAHRTMAFGTKIQFAYKGKTCVAVVQDRGPGTKSLEFDLGPGTAQALGFSGSGYVQWRIVK